MSISTLRSLDGTGDTRVNWDPDNASEVEAARAHYDSLKAKGYLAYRVQGEGQGEVIRQFDPTASEIIMAPQLVGG
jgi:hypothetical protein